MAGNGVCRDRRRGHRLIIAAAFAGQAAIIAVVAAGSARGTSAAVSVTAGPAFSAAPAPAGPPSPAVPPGTAPPVPAVPLPPGEIAVMVSAAGPGSASQGGASQGGASQSGASRSGASQSGDIGFPAPEDPPLLVLRPGADTAITVTLTIPPGARVRGLWLGVAADQGAGSPHVRRLLVASLNASPGRGRHAYVLHWTMPAGTPAGAGSQLVLNVRHAGGADDQAPIAELVSG